MMRQCMITQDAVFHGSAITLQIVLPYSVRIWYFWTYCGCLHEGFKCAHTCMHVRWRCQEYPEIATQTAPAYQVKIQTRNQEMQSYPNVQLVNRGSAGAPYNHVLVREVLDTLSGCFLHYICIISRRILCSSLLTHSLGGTEEQRRTHTS